MKGQARVGGLVLGLSLLTTPAAAASWEPEAWPAPAPGVYAGPVVVEEAGALARLWRWYRGRSEQDGARCPYYPTCSGFGRASVRQHGVVVGGWLTADRLMREYPGMDKVDDYPLVTPHGTPRFLDPVPDTLRDGRRRGRAAPQAEDAAASVPDTSAAPSQ